MISGEKRTDRCPEGGCTACEDFAECEFCDACAVCDPDCSCSGCKKEVWNCLECGKYEGRDCDDKEIVSIDYLDSLESACEANGWKWDRLERTYIKGSVSISMQYFYTLEACSTRFPEV